MKILIGQSYYRILDPKEHRRNMPYPPLGTLYAIASLKKSAHEIIFFDAMLAEDPEEFNRKIEEVQPNLVLIYDDEFNYLTKMCLSNMRAAAISFIKKAKEFSIPTVIYSSDATDFCQHYLDAGCDVIMYGEAEQTLQEVIEAFSLNIFEKKKFEIAGLKFFHEDYIYKTAVRKVVKNIDEFPDADYSILDIISYKNIWLKNHGYFSINISTTRGCPYKCNWCAKPLYGQIYNCRSPKAVAEEIKKLSDNYGIDHIWITDDIFGLKAGWIGSFADECKNIGIKIPYKCLSRPDLLLRGNTIESLRESGCKTIWIGAESGSQKILDAMDKGTTVEQIYKAALKTKQAGIEIAFFIQFGYPGETWEDINLTRKMIKDCSPDDIGISVSYPLPGTKFYENVKDDMGKKTNWKDSDDLDLMFPGRYEKQFYKLLHKLVHYEYRAAAILSKKKYSKIFHFFYYALQFLIIRINISKYLRVENLFPLIKLK
jgi:anaerobic magnesium-protoporphyrin IX monomethyl ester cyclase